MIHIASQAAPFADRVLVAMGLFGSLVLRPVASGLAHTFHCQNVRAYVFWWGLDYVSICVAVLCSSIVSGRFAFRCELSLQIFYYLSAGGLFVSTLLSVVFVASHGIRAISFVLFVVFANGVPFVYCLITKSQGLAANAFPSEYLLLWGLSLAIMTFGLIIKSTAVPEVFAPGKYDSCGHSHFIWHVAINSGYCLILFDWKTYLHWRHNVGCV